jgi:hypothetical protein
MERTVAATLAAWLRAPDRKPLVLRGARQVGKTWLVRDLARKSGRELAEINFERDPSFARYFLTNDPAKILGELSLALGQDVSPERSLLFLDEIHAATSVFAKLRWFYEEALPPGGGRRIAAGAEPWGGPFQHAGGPRLVPAHRADGVSRVRRGP